MFWFILGLVSLIVVATVWFVIRNSEEIDLYKRGITAVCRLTCILKELGYNEEEVKEVLENACEAETKEEYVRKLEGLVSYYEKVV